MAREPRDRRQRSRTRALTQTLTWEQVHARRVERSCLVERADSIVEAVRAVGGVQAQAAGAAEIAVGVRVDGVTREDVRDELWERRGIVRVWAHRGTVHLLPADELPLWIAALRGPSPYWHTHEWRERHGLTARRVEAIVAAIGAALDGRVLTRDELAEDVAGRVGAWARERVAAQWAELLGPAAYSGLLLHGPPRGGRATFARADQWIGGWREHDPAVALAELFRRYLHTYGPAQPRDFSRWLGVDPERVEAAVERLGAELQEVRVNRRRALLPAGDAEVPERRSTRLLARYDCYVLGCQPRERVVPRDIVPRLRAHPRGRFEVAAGHWCLLVDGVVAGVWEPRDDGRIRVEPFVDLTAAQRKELKDEAARLGKFLATMGTLSIGPLEAA